MLGRTSILESHEFSSDTGGTHGSPFVLCMCVHCVCACVQRRVDSMWVLDRYIHAFICKRHRTARLYCRNSTIHYNYETKMTSTVLLLRTIYTPMIQLNHRFRIFCIKVHIKGIPSLWIVTQYVLYQKQREIDRGWRQEYKRPYIHPQESSYILQYAPTASHQLQKWRRKREKVTPDCPWIIHQPGQSDVLLDISRGIFFAQDDLRRILW